MILSRQLNFTETIKKDFFLWKNIEHTTMNGKTHFLKKSKVQLKFFYII